MRRRLRIASVGVAALAILLFGVPLGIAADRANHAQAVDRLQREATTAVGAVPAELAGADPVELPATSDGSRLALYTPDGRRAQGQGPAAADPVVRLALHGAASDGDAGGELVVAAPVLAGEAVIGAVRAALPESAVEQPVHQLWLVTAGLGSIVLLLAAGVATWLSAWLTRPIDALAASAARLRAGDFAVSSRPSGVPEIDAVGEALARTAARLGDVLSRERAFSAQAAHQLRTPVAALRVQLESAGRDDGPEARPWLADSLHQVERLEATVEDLLALARHRASGAERLSLRAQLDDLEREWHGRLSAAGRPLRVRIEPGAPDARISPEAARQVLNVLLDNALRHGAGAVTVEARQAGAGVVIDVADEGPGLAGGAEAAFSRERAGASSIGLPLARALAEAEGARLVVRRAGPSPVVSLYLLPAEQARS